ncbi:MAG: ATP-binding cassette domain-containing protein [Phycisphaerales bacterium]
MTPAVLAERVAVLRAGRRALDSVSMRVEQGEWVALIGRNGSGKSTLLLATAGLLRTAEGTLRTAGSIGVCLQRPSLDPLLTVAENARLFARLFGVTRGETESRLERFLIAGDLTTWKSTRVGQLSGGLARRADLLRACMLEPEVLLLDEPTAGLDQPSRERFLAQVSHLRGDGRPTVIWATHDDTEARAAGRVLVLDGGRIVDELDQPAESEADELCRVRHADGSSELLDRRAASRLAERAIQQGEPISVERATLLDLSRLRRASAPGVVS